MIRRAIGFTPMETRRSVLIEASELADELGYEAVLVPEGWGMDSTVILTEIALATKRIRPVSGILSIWSRSAATIAMNSATLFDVSDGRYILGLGVSTPALVEGFHDVEYRRPAAKLQQVAVSVRNLFHGNRAALNRDTDAKPLRLAMDLPHDLPIIVAGMGPLTRRVAAVHGDGWFPVFTARDQLGSQIAELQEIRASEGLDPESFATFFGPVTAIGDDLERARSIAASNVAWYIVAMGDNYARLLTEQGFGEEVEAIIAANPKPRPGSCVIPPEAIHILDQLGLVTTPEDTQEALAPWDALGGVTGVGLSPGLAPEAIFDIIRAAAPPKDNT